MSQNGKGDANRTTDRKRFRDGYDQVYGDREKQDGRKTKLIIRDGEVIEEDRSTRQLVFIDPGPLRVDCFEQLRKRSLRLLDNYLKTLHMREKDLGL